MFVTVAVVVALATLYAGLVVRVRRRARRQRAAWFTHAQAPDVIAEALRRSTGAGRWI